jgi:hypothetical protein
MIMVISDNNDHRLLFSSLRMIITVKISLYFQGSEKIYLTPSCTSLLEVTTNYFTIGGMSHSVHKVDKHWAVFLELSYNNYVTTYMQFVSLAA